jgi:hypothetical protein
MKTHWLLPLTAALALLLAGCQTVPTVGAEARPGTDFSIYKTFALLPLPPGGPPSDPGMTLRLSSTASRAITETLQARGFESRPIEAADMAVALRGQSVPRVEVIDWGYRPTYYGYGNWYGGYRDVDVRSYEEYTVIIDILDNKTREPVWSGWSRVPGGGKVSAEPMRECIQRILARFPPAPPAP